MRVQWTFTFCRPESYAGRLESLCWDWENEVSRNRVIYAGKEVSKERILRSVTRFLRIQRKTILLEVLYKVSSKTITQAVRFPMNHREIETFVFLRFCVIFFSMELQSYDNEIIELVSIHVSIIKHFSYQTKLIPEWLRANWSKWSACWSVWSASSRQNSSWREGKSASSIHIVAVIWVIHTLPLLINNLHSTQLHKLERRKYVMLYTTKSSSPIHSSSSTSTGESGEEKKWKNTTSVRVKNQLEKHQTILTHAK